MANVHYQELQAKVTITLFSNNTKTFLVVFNATNKQISNPEDRKLELRNQGLKTQVCTKFLGMQLDSQNIVKKYVENFVFLLIQTVPSHIYTVSFMGKPRSAMQLAGVVRTVAEVLIKMVVTSLVLEQQTTTLWLMNRPTF